MKYSYLFPSNIYVKRLYNAKRHIQPREAKIPQLPLASFLFTRYKNLFYAVSSFFYKMSFVAALCRFMSYYAVLFLASLNVGVHNLLFISHLLPQFTLLALMHLSTVT